MAKKTAVPNPANPDFSSMFNWGLKLTDYKELFLIAGHMAHDATGATPHPGDAVGQTKYILDNFPAYLESAGYTKHDIIRTEFTMTKAVPAQAYDEIFALFAEFFADVEVKPTAGTLRVIEALAIPDMLVEYEFWCAK
jgi:enamine deaminase RidA (YjgF/YER057c/UK114 family)